LIDHIFCKENFGQNWFSYPRLYKIMVDTSPSGSKFVEVGSWKGKSSAYMAVEIANSKKDIEFYCVDHWLGSIEHYDKNADAYEPNIHNLYEIFIQNMKPVEQYYKPLRMTSLEASTYFEDKSLDFVFIDASHEYDDVCNDIRAWKPKVKCEGVIAGHDYYADGKFPGVKKAVDENIDNFFVSDLCWVHTVI
jgi:predicted O-methyltransferase YrrM